MPLFEFSIILYQPKHVILCLPGTDSIGRSVDCLCCGQRWSGRFRSTPATGATSVPLAWSDPPLLPLSKIEQDKLPGFPWQETSSCCGARVHTHPEAALALPGLTQLRGCCCSKSPKALPPLPVPRTEIPPPRGLYVPRRCCCTEPAVGGVGGLLVLPSPLPPRSLLLSGSDYLRARIPVLASE